MRAAFYIVSFILVGVMMAGFIYVIQSRAKRHGAWESPALAMHTLPPLRGGNTSSPRADPAISGRDR